MGDQMAYGIIITTTLRTYENTHTHTHTHPPTHTHTHTLTHLRLAEPHDDAVEPEVSEQLHDPLGRLLDGLHTLGQLVS